MSFRIIMVPKDWKHPRNAWGKYIPLIEGNYAEDEKMFLELSNKKGLQAAIEQFGGCPNKNNYRPIWAYNERTHYMMCENKPYGLPCSEVFDSLDSLVSWLADLHPCHLSTEPEEVMEVPDEDDILQSICERAGREAYINNRKLSAGAEGS